MARFLRSVRLGCLLLLLAAGWTVSAWTRSTDLLSPDGLRAAYVVVETTPLTGAELLRARSRGEPQELSTSRLYVCDADGRRSREIACLPESIDSRVTWLDDGRLALWCTASHSFAVFSTTGQARAPLGLPEGVHVGEYAFSSDGQRLLFTGSVQYALDDQHDGLFLYDLTERQYRCLYEGETLGRPAWSPDERTAAITTPRAGQRYMLALVDVAGGTAVETNEDGYIARLAADGESLFYATLGHPFFRAGETRPAARSLGVLDPSRRTRRILAPPPPSSPDARGAQWYNVQHLSPSPDGKWIAYQRFGAIHRAAQDIERRVSELWVVAGDGSRWACVTTGVRQFAWTADSGALAVLHESGVKKYPLVRAAFTPIPSCDSYAGPVQFSAPKAAQFQRKPDAACDCTALLARHRAWLVQDPTAPESFRYVWHGDHQERTTWAAGIGMLVEAGATHPDGTWHGRLAEWIEPDFRASWRVAEDEQAAFPRDEPPEALAARVSQRRRGLAFRCAAMAWASATGEYVIRRVEGRPLEGKYILYVVPRRKSVRVEMPFFQQEDVRRFQLHVEVSSGEIVREVDYGPRSEPLLTLDFTQYASNGAGGAVPLHVQSRKSDGVTGELLARWFSQGAWMVDACSQERRQEHLTDIAVSLDERAKAQLERRGAEIRALADGAEPDRRISLETYAYQFGKYYSLAGRAGRVVFTLGPKSEIALRCEGDWRAGPLVCLLFGDNADFPIYAQEAQTTPGSASIQMDFSRQVWSRQIRRFHLSCGGRRVALATESAIHDIPAWSYSPGVHDVRMPSDSSAGMPVVRRVEISGEGEQRRIQLCSYSPTGSLNDDDLLAFVGFNAANQAVRAGHARAPFDNGGRHGDRARAEMLLPGGADFRDCAAWTLGGLPGGMSTYLGWRLRIVDTGEPRASLEELLDAEVPEAWKAGVLWLQRQYVERVGGHQMERGLDAITPHRERLRRLLATWSDPEVLGGCMLLLAPMVQPDEAERFRPFLAHESDYVKDAAAVAMAMLGDPAGVDRLPAIFQRSPSNSKSYSHPVDGYGQRLLRAECLEAMSRLATPEMVEFLGQRLIDVIDEARRTSSWGENAWNLARFLANTGRPEAGPWLIRVLDLRDDLDDAIAGGLASASREAWALEVFNAGIQRGRRHLIEAAPGDPALIPAVAQWLLSATGSESPKGEAVLLLSRMEDGKGLPKLQELFERCRGGDDVNLRLLLCRQLMQAGDLRAVEDGLNGIVDAARDSGGSRPYWPIWDLLNAALDEGRKPLPREMTAGIGRRLRSSDVIEVRVMLDMIEPMVVVPDELRPALRQLSDHADPDIAQRAQALAER